MSKWIYAILALGVAAGLSAPAQARLDNGPVSSLYDADGRSATKITARSNMPKSSTARSSMGRSSTRRNTARSKPVRPA